MGVLVTIESTMHPHKQQTAAKFSFSSSSENRWLILQIFNQSSGNMKTGVLVTIESIMLTFLIE
ncbi:MAG: hypothetical protein DRI57_03295 [Deltaproteobacteria bacterium]|nr:MAG: hypothetical protein DRI57_03295 [Deltaproteobacteria bacterium]